MKDAHTTEPIEPCELGTILKLAGIRNLPEPCIPGVLANLALLRQHWRTVSDEAPDADPPR
jgi:hypothetical protein